MQKLNDLSRSLTALEPNGTLIAVIEMSLSSWLVAGIVPGVERQPLKKLAVDESALLKLLHRWREEAEKAGRRIERIAVAFEARDSDHQVREFIESEMTCRDMLAARGREQKGSGYGGNLSGVGRLLRHASVARAQSLMSSYRFYFRRIS